MENEEPKVEQPTEPQKAEENVQPTVAPVKKTGREKKILLVIGGIILLLIIFGSRSGNKSQQASPSATPTSAPVAMQITAKQLADKFQLLEIYGNFLRNFLFFVIPIMFFAYVPAGILLGKLPWYFVVFGAVINIWLYVISVFLWRRGLKNYQSASS